MTTQLIVTERANSQSRSLSRRSLRLAWLSFAWTLVVLFFMAGTLLLVVRYVAMPRVDQMRPRIEQIASRVFKAPVTIGRIDASWRGLNPQLALRDVRIASGSDRPDFSLPLVEGTVSWVSVVVLEPRFAELRVEALDLDIVRLPGNRFSVGGFVFDPNQKGEDSGAADWILAQGEVVIRDARIRYSDRRDSAIAKDFELSHANLQLEKVFGAHIVGLQAQPTSTVAGPIDLRARFRHSPFSTPSDFTRWTGEAFAAVDYADLAALALLFEVPAKIASAQGAVRSWVNFDNARITRVIADFALTNVNVTLAENLDPLTLQSLQGRIRQRMWGTDDGTGGQEFEANRLALVTASNESIAPFDLKVRTTRAKGASPARTQVQADRVDMHTLSWFAMHVPVAPELRDTLSKHALRGTLTGLTAGWPGSAPQLKTLSLKTRFEGFTSAAQPGAPYDNQSAWHPPGLPGFENLSGTVDIADGAGSMQLTSKDATLLLPGVFAEPRVKLAKLTTAARWKWEPALEVRIDSAFASNADMELEVIGTYRAVGGDKNGPGWLDLTSRIARLNAPAAHRYVPVVVGTTTLHWLQHALVAGRVTDGTVRIKGDLARFPFEGQNDAEFRIAAHVTDATLDVYPSKVQGDGSTEGPRTWPLLRDIDADLLFDRRSMTVTAQRAATYGAKLSNVVARIPELGHNATLDVRGVADGPLADMVRYVNTSPVSRWTGGVTANAEATGNAKLELRLSIPLAHASDSQVAGTLNFANNDVQLAEGPPFSRVTGALQFTEAGVQNTSLNATVLGGQSRIETSRRVDGEPIFTATGIATVPALRRAVSLTPVQHILDRSQGQARYTATLTLKPSPELKIDSDLIGISVDGVAPLRKTAQEAMPLRIERVPLGDSDEWRVVAGRVLAVRIERRRERGELRVARGVIALNEPANLPEAGLLILATVPRLDVEAWSAFLAGGEATPKPTGAATTPLGAGIELFAIRTPELVLMGRTFRNVTLGASRTTDGGFNTNIVSDGVSGYVAWKPEQITARLSRLLIPAARKSEVVDALNSAQTELPALDIAAEQFELSGLKLGRLELVAQNAGGSSAPAWRVRRFDITNSDMKFSATGEWAPAASGKARHTKLNFKFDARDAGATLDRLGFPGAMAAGQGALEGDIEWLGSPLDLDYATLSGKLALSIDDGRFLKVDTGNAARLLSLLSLQSLSRTLLFDAGRPFSEGFAYSSIRADATLAQGVMSTTNFRMTGATATALMSGTINLRNETQQLHLVVLPEIDASTAALALGVANPILGLGAFVAQYVLRNPLSKVFALEYDIAGSWTDPTITRRGRVAGADAEAIR